MKHLYIIVEGQTELEFVNSILIPYFFEKGINTYIQAVPIDMKGGGHGFNNIEHFKNTVRPLLHCEEEPVITTMIDYYGINSEKKIPGFLSCNAKNTVEERISCLENRLSEIVNNIRSYGHFIPNIIKHEMETLLFACPEEGFVLEPEAIKNEVIQVKSEFENIEDINNSPELSPSKRLQEIYELNGKKYNKVVDGIDIAELTGIENILKECPRFKRWIENVIESLLAS